MGVQTKEIEWQVTETQGSISGERIRSKTRYWLWWNIFTYCENVFNSSYTGINNKSESWIGAIQHKDYISIWWSWWIDLYGATKKLQG